MAGTPTFADVLDRHLQVRASALLAPGRHRDVVSLACSHPVRLVRCCPLLGRFSPPGRVFLSGRVFRPAAGAHHGTAGGARGPGLSRQRAPGFIVRSGGAEACVPTRGAATASRYTSGCRSGGTSSARSGVRLSARRVSHASPARHELNRALRRQLPTLNAQRPRPVA